MPFREFHYRWDFELPASAQALWPLVADTNRFNRDAGVPAVSDEGGGGSDGARRRHRRILRLSLFGVPVRWEEEPFEWARPYRYGVRRRYLNGPVEEMRVEAELVPRTENSTRLIYEVWARPRNALGLVAIPLQIGRVSARSFRETFRRYAELARQSQPALRLLADVQLTADGRAHLELAQRELLEKGCVPNLVARLVDTVERGDDLTLSRLRPYALADHWRAPRRAVLELFLQATRAGLLDLRWDLLCPLCRGPQQSPASLRDLQSSAHCDGCHIDFAANFERSVELTFRPNPSVRPVESRTFCSGGPQLTPHVVAQQLLAPGVTRTLRLALEEGRYRLRTPGLPGAQSLYVSSAGQTEATLRARGGEAWPDDETHLSETPLLRLENRTDDEQLFILERTAWSDQAATAAEVTALQLFRDLFASEALRPGDQVSVGSLTILFTDLRGSTQLYRQIGDAVAFGAVMNHFDVLREAIADEGGAIVKTVGDAVMAVFYRPSAALRAIVRAQKALASPPPGARPLALKAGIHTGPCIAVTLNERLDYFGSNVNIAARLEPLSTGSDIIISAHVHADPEVSALLADPRGGLRAELLEASLKGFDAERFALWRVSPAN